MLEKMLPQNWVLRPMHPDELSVLYDITHLAMGPYVQQAYGAWDETYQRHQCEASYTSMPHQCIVVDGHVLGVLSVQQETQQHYLRKLYLHPQAQAQGLGGTVLRHVIACADVRGLPVKLRVFHINPAQRLYERLGFKTTEMVDDIRRVMIRMPTAG
ncbi:MAG: GNAT family N-acetyltransferase [Burkholderiaceae bacterium]